MLSYHEMIIYLRNFKYILGKIFSIDDGNVGNIQDRFDIHVWMKFSCRSNCKKLLFLNHFTAVLFFRKTKKSNFQESIYYHLGFMSGIIFKETTYRFYVAIMLRMSLSMILFETWNDA